MGEGFGTRETNRYIVDGEGQKFLIRVRPASTSEAANSTVRAVVNWQSSIR